MNRLRVLAAVGLIVFAVSACASEAPPAETPGAAGQVEASAVNTDIPVEALPDPLPAPYLFVDEVTEERAPITETTYVVQPGDTLANIATRFCLTVEEVQRLNNIVDVDSLSVGQELRVPIREGGCGAASPQTTEDDDSAAEAPQRPPGEIYIVQPGDTLAEIGFSFGFTWVELMSYNSLTEAQAANLQVGQALIIPPAPEGAPAEADPSDSQTEQQSDASEPPG